MSVYDVTFDVLLAATLPLLGWRAISARSIERAVVLFIAFGFVSSLAWTRLDAVDVALVEAAVSSALTGALLLSSLRWADREPPAVRHRNGALHLFVAMGVLGLLWTIAQLPAQREGLTPLVLESLEDTGVEHPVTAVLLDFRGYDTLLEVIVLLSAAVAVRIARATPRWRATQGPRLLTMFANNLVPVGLVCAAYLLWTGSHAPGGAFQAGSILAGCGVTLLLSGRIRPPGFSSWVARTAMLLGPAVFLVIAAWPLVGGASLLDYPADRAGALVFAVELGLSLSIGFILFVFFPSPPRPERS